MTTTAEVMPTAHAEMRDATGRALGTAHLVFTSDGVRLSGTLDGLPAGAHGIHFHETGRCDLAPPTPFQSAGGHYNPAGREHGTLNPAGPHAGDLPNITVGANGTVSLTEAAVTVQMNETARAGLLDADGAALVIHANADDYRTNPSGNSGGRIACGAIER